MSNFAPGNTVLILEGPFVGYSGPIKSVNDTEILIEVEFFGRKTPLKCAPDTIIALDQLSSSSDHLTPDSPFFPDDTVFIHRSADYKHPQTGQVGQVIAVMPDSKKCVIHLDKQPLSAFPFAQLSLIQPERRPPEEDYLKAISAAIPMRGYGPRLTRWWQEQANQKKWSIAQMPELHAAFLAFKADLDAEIAAEIKRQHELLRQAFRGLSSAQKMKKWQTEWYSWIEYRSYLQSYPNRSDEAIFFDIEDYSSGRALRDRCTTHMANAGRAGYAYDAIPFRPLSTPPLPDADTSLSSPTATEFIPLAPPSSSPRHQPVSQEPEGLFRAELIDLVRSPDKRAVATLITRYTDLTNQPGFDLERVHRWTDLELALLATRQEEAILAVLHHHLPDRLPRPYRIQGLKLKGDTSPFPWPDNPWEITADETVENALARIWTPMKHLAPRFVALLQNCTTGLALVRQETDLEPNLVYLLLIAAVPLRLPLSNQDNLTWLPIADQTLLNWLGQKTFSLITGTPPRKADDDYAERLSAFRLPLALRELYAIHRELSNWQMRIHPPEQLETLLSGLLNYEQEEQRNHSLNIFHTRNQGIFPQQFVELASHISGNVTVFDRDQLDRRLDPQVADWDHETWQVTGHQTFWSWFDEDIPRMFNLLGE